METPGPELVTKIPAHCNQIFASAATPPARLYPHELDGFLIRQSKKTVEATLGKPFKVVVNADGDNAYA